ncbi:MAG: hypothetical protein K9J83_00635 [Desulfarculaceae bacterium]|nr:hypothetical protein [Desulfarculaceae bacterium]
MKSLNESREYTAPFTETQINRLLSWYDLTFHREDTCTEYFLTAREDLELISYSLVLSYSPSTRNICIAKFHPELYTRADSKYLSSACLSLMIEHFSKEYLLDSTTKITLNTQPDVFNNFYAKLKDFNFHIHRHCLGDTLELISDFHPLDIKTDMVHQHMFSEHEAAFLV